MSMSRILKANPVCQLLGIDYPVCQAGMYSVAYGALAAAVSKAGGLGVIGSAFMTDEEELRREIQVVKRATDKPFGVDILFAEVAGGDATTSGYTREVEGAIEVSFEEQVPVIVSGLGSPARIIERARAAGVKVMSLVGTTRQARKVEAAGVDIIIASGADGGGHVGRVGTLPLVSEVVDNVKVPVIAAGGLADGRSLVAALALGAHGVWMGTRFIATEEARGHINYKNKIVEIDVDGTVVTRAHSGKTARIIRNGFTEAWVGRDAEIKPFPYQLREVGQPASVRGRQEGDVEMGVLAAGQSAGLIHDVVPAGEVVCDVMRQASAILDGWSGDTTV
jgi:enoyl-[acyl-carrier protein] reductase II